MHRGGRPLTRHGFVASCYLVVRLANLQHSGSDAYSWTLRYDSAGGLEPPHAVTIGGPVRRKSTRSQGERADGNDAATGPGILATGTVAPGREIIDALRGTDVAAAEGAFAHVFRYYYLALVRVARSTYVAERADAEEIVQDMYTRLWRERRKLPSDLSAEACLFTRLRSDALNFVAAHRRHRALADTTQLDDVAEPRSGVDALMRRFLAHDLNEAVRRLPEKCREVFILKHFNDQTTHEIAEATGLRPDSVEKHLARGKARMRQLLGARVV
jgi:RNA polymerase sigma-70 factor (ECF subfamily)